MPLSDLPTELLQQILRHLPPSSFAATSETCKALRRVADTPLLWRFFCTSEYRFWDPRHGIQQALARPVEETSWKAWFIARRKLDRRVDRLVDQLVNHQQERIEMMDTLINIETYTCDPHGWRNNWDIKDSLLRHIKCDEQAEDVLARRFWAQAVLERLHRERAIMLWNSLNTGDDVEAPRSEDRSDGKIDLETALAAFDMFVDGMEDANCGDVAGPLDELATRFQSAYPEHHTWSTRALATNLANFLRNQGYQGAQAEQYHALPNNFIMRALKDPEHRALPLVCVAIFCAVGRRIGLDARPCGFPMHVYAIIHTSTGQDLDGHPVPDGMPDTSRRMYIDAFRPGVEVPASDLTAQLRSMGASSRDPELFLGAASVRDIVVRSGRNIYHSIRMGGNDTQNRDDQEQSNAWPDGDMSSYSFLWTQLLVHPDRNRADFYQEVLAIFCELFQQQVPWDAELIREFILPNLVPGPHIAHLNAMLRRIRQADAIPPSQVSRDTDAKRAVSYRIGQQLRHQRYDYRGVIIGWDVTCEANEAWIMQMGVDRLGRGRSQSFYHVLAEDKSLRYVAEDNIKPFAETPSAALMKLAGRYFRRWDAEEKVFVSNIRAEYPDD